MIKEELIQRSPVRAFMNSIDGGLKAGELGVIASPSGIGKTSVLVQIALDKLLQGKKIIHISFTQHTDNILVWYENIFDEFIKRKNLENEGDVKNEIVKNRVLMKFNQDVLTSVQILKSVRVLMTEGGFNAETIIIDGFNFADASIDRIAHVKAFAKEMGISVWYSCTIKGEKPFYDKNTIPLVLKDSVELFDIVTVLEPQQNHTALSVSYNRGVNNPEHKSLRLDPKTLLMLES